MRILGSSLLVKDNIRDLLEPFRVQPVNDSLQLHINFGIVAVTLKKSGSSTKIMSRKAFSR
jgi:hypothetical protein